jgi:ectoine hydroxylase-related dioxygenase (phytanoyl-CoA dioxygenase family)
MSTAPASASATALPAPTTDLDRARGDLDAHGYCLVEAALAPDHIATVRAALARAAAEDVESGVATFDSGGSNQRVWQLLNRGPVFRDLAVHPIALDLIGGLLGGHVPQHIGGATDELPNFLLSNLAANIAGPGGKPQFLHADQVFAPLPWPPFPLTASVMWMIDDFTSANGATRIVPGSHTEARNADPDAVAHTVPVEAPAGTAMVFDGRVWHGTGANETEARRNGILAYYSVPWLRQQENFTVSCSPDLVAALTPELRRLVGFDMYAFYGMIGGIRGAGRVARRAAGEPS